MEVTWSVKSTLLLTITDGSGVSVGRSLTLVLLTTRDKLMAASVTIGGTEEEEGDHDEDTGHEKVSASSR